MLPDVVESLFEQVAGDVTADLLTVGLQQLLQQRCEHPHQMLRRSQLVFNAFKARWERFMKKSFIHAGFVEEADPSHDPGDLIQLLLFVLLQERHESCQFSVRENTLQGSWSKRGRVELIIGANVEGPLHKQSNWLLNGFSPSTGVMMSLQTFNLWLASRCQRLRVSSRWNAAGYMKQFYSTEH